jgi:hypothetical protein
MGVRNGKVKYDDFVKMLRSIAAEQNMPLTSTKEHTKPPTAGKTELPAEHGVTLGNDGESDYTAQSTQSEGPEGRVVASYQHRVPPKTAASTRLVRKPQPSLASSQWARHGQREQGVRRVLGLEGSDEQGFRRVLGLEGSDVPLTYALLHDNRERMLAGIVKRLAPPRSAQHQRGSSSASNFLKGATIHIYIHIHIYIRIHIHIHIHVHVHAQIHTYT